jgi:FlaA1/EpsC-like NDP-sugar epimerase
MTRFLLSLEQAVDTIFAAMRHGTRGETYIPRVPSANVMDVASVLVGSRKVPIVITGIRPGEKVHESLVSEEEAYRTFPRGDYYAIQPMLPELMISSHDQTPLGREYSSADNVMTREQVTHLLEKNQLMIDDRTKAEQGAEQDMLA